MLLLLGVAAALACAAAAPAAPVPLYKTPGAPGTPI
jgi:hypothetical protein